MKLPFWMNPIFWGFFWIVVAIISFTLPAEYYQIHLRAPKQISFSNLIFIISALFVFIVGLLSSGLFKRRKNSHFKQSIHSDLRFVLEQRGFRVVLTLFTALMLVAYAIWLFPIMNSSSLIRLLNGDWLNLREDAYQISGITTMTQFGVPLAIVSTYGSTLCKGSKKTFYKRVLVIIIVLSTLRAFLVSERLALLECLVPASAAYFIINYQQKYHLRFMPILGIIAVIFFFGSTEYFRSWNYYGRLEDSFGYFVLTRFASYYVSSFNNFAIIADWIQPMYQPVHSFGFIYKLPLPGFEALNQIQENVWQRKLSIALFNYGNPEFNLFSGLGMLVHDFGKEFALIAMFVLGYATALINQSLKSGKIFGLFFYPFWLIGLFEFGRLLYWGTSRSFYIYMVLVILLIISNKMLKQVSNNPDKYL